MVHSRGAAMIAVRHDPPFVVIHPTAYLEPDQFSLYRKACEGARYDFDRKLSVSSLDKIGAILRRLRTLFPVDVDLETLDAIDRLEAQTWVDLQSAKDRIERIDADIRQRTQNTKWMFGYQKSGAEWLTLRTGGALLGDDMGLGKTLQALTAVPTQAPVLVVGPVVAKGIWPKEAKKWRPQLKAFAISGKNNFRWPKPGEMVVTNYDVLPDGHTEACLAKQRKAKQDRKKRAIVCAGCGEHLANCPENVVFIVDEGHKIKGSKTIRTRSVRAISNTVRKRSGRAWVLTGTPLANRPPDLWNVLEAADLAREAFGSYQDFVRLFHGSRVEFGGGKSGMVWGRPDPEVAERLRRVMLRRLKVDVLLELPEKRYEEITVEIDKKTIAACDAALDAAKVNGPADLERKLSTKTIGFEDFATVRAALATAKIEAMLEIVEEQEEAEEPFIVFSAHRAPIDLLGKRKGWAIITGDVSAKNREAIVESFQAGELKGLGLTIRAGGEGITLTRANRSLFVDLEPVPALNDQAADRIYRVGQTRGVLISILVANHALDASLAKILFKKEALIDATVNAAKAVS